MLLLLRSSSSDSTTPSSFLLSFPTRKGVIEVIEGEKRYEELTDSKVVIGKEELENGARVTLREVKGSQVYICGTISQLRIKGARNSMIATGPVTGSVYLEDCENCIVITANQQLRIHRSIDCQLYITTKSPAIILEDCSGLTVAPYLRWLPDDLQLFQQCQFEDILEPACHWDQVRDFNWLKAEHSPNWSVLPLSQRLSSLSFP
jgi:tubulin-specific chaperone C